MKALIDKTHKFLRHMRWKAHFFDNPSTKEQQENFGCNSEKWLPLIKDTSAFETNMYDLIKNIEWITSN